MRAVASLISDVGVLKKAGLVSLNTIYDGGGFNIMMINLPLP